MLISQKLMIRYTGNGLERTFSSNSQKIYNVNAEENMQIYGAEKEKDRLLM